MLRRTDFWTGVDKAGSCWWWRGAKNELGYGIVSNGGGHNRRRAHRVAWELTNGPIPAGLFVLHHCDNPPCVNPEHLFLGTQGDNMRDMAAKGRNRFQDWLGKNQTGELNRMARLTAADVLSIRAAASAGEKHKEIAAVFGISRAAVSLIVERKRWVHVS